MVQILGRIISMKLKFNSLLNWLIVILYGITIASIPIFSFNKILYLATWGLTGLLILSIGIYSLKNKYFHFDTISLALFLFAFSAFFSSLINGMKGFNFTPILLPILIILIYGYAKMSKSSKKMLFAAYFGIIVFLICFIYHYRQQLLHLDFSSRLGDYFGDENDIAIMLGFGIVTTIYLILFSKKIGIIIPSVILLIPFLVCGFSTGSKIILLIIVISIVISIFLFFGKKKWWVSLIVIVSFIAIGIILLSLPMFSTISTRLYQFIYTMTGQSVKGTTKTDYSTIFRYYMFCDGIEMFLRKPLFGFGIWGFATYGGINNGWSHNHISEGLCNFGAIGFILFHIPFIKSYIRFFKEKDKKQFIHPFLLLIFFTAAMISVSFFTQKIFAFVIAPIYALMIESKPLEFNKIFIKENKHANITSN